MSLVDRQFMGISQSTAEVAYTYNDTDDARSLQRYLARELSPSATLTSDPVGDEPFIFNEPDLTEEGQFRRPAITIRMIPAGLTEGGQNYRSVNFGVTHMVVLTAYGTTRQKTIELESGYSVCWRLADAPQCGFLCGRQISTPALRDSPECCHYP